MQSSNILKAEVSDALINKGLLHEYKNRTLVDDSVTDVTAVLLSIHLLDETKGTTGQTIENVKEFFCSLGKKEENFPVALHRTKKKEFVEIKKGLLFLTVPGLKKIRQLSNTNLDQQTHLIKAGQNFTAKKRFEEALAGKLKSPEILLCDTYISADTLYPLSNLLEKVKSLKILTTNIVHTEKFEGYVKLLEKETGVKVEVKVNKKLHDRYLICGQECWSIGASIKDMGNKDMLIRNTPELVQSMTELFFERWNES